jgi:hypothetical protein
MSGFFYFLEDTNQADTEAIESAGLSDRLPIGHIEQRPVSQGPSGKSGVVLAYSGVVLYQPETQKWRDCGGYWLGYDKEKPPMPKDILREDALAGHLCKLGDGENWLIPICRAIQTGAFFEKGIQFALSESGEWEERIRPEFTKLCKDIEVLYSAFSAQYFGQEITVDDGENFNQFDACERALALNYRISKWEIDALSLFTQEALTLIAQAMIDVPTILDVVKKNQGS